MRRLIKAVLITIGSGLTSVLFVSLSNVLESLSHYRFPSVYDLIYYLLSSSYHSIRYLINIRSWGKWEFLFFAFGATLALVIQAQLLLNAFIQKHSPKLANLQTKNPLWRFILIVVLIFCGFVWASKATFFSFIHNEQDKASIYQAVIRHMYDLDTELYQKPLEKTALYIVRSTSDSSSVSDFDFTAPLFYNHYLFFSQPRRNEVVLPETVQKDITTSLSDLPTKIIWINYGDSVVGNNDVYIELGNIKYEYNKASVGGNIMFSPNARGSSTRGYSLEKKNGIWVIIDIIYAEDMYE